MRLLEGPHAPIRLWAEDADDATIRQLRLLAAQPFIAHHVAAMADAHVAHGVAVGTVFATRSTVVPGALGGDLGCGMSAVRLGARAASLDRRMLERVLVDLGRAIPAGDAVHRGPGLEAPAALFEAELSTRALARTRDALVRRHLGTLGGGNHFLELDRDAEGELWLLVHSGSRGLGAAVAAHHTREPLSGLDTDDEAGRAYLGDHAFALAFARENRAALALRAQDVLSGVLGASLVPDEVVDIHHNFVARERWFGEDLLVHRKGAVAVPRGARALVPGSMGTASYVVEGLGDDASYGSCSHGAGRVMSRREARARVSREALAASMRRVVYPARNARVLVEESPSAYRDIGDVLDAQRDLVRRVVRLEPVMVLKG